MIRFNHQEIENEIKYTLTTISSEEEFLFQLPFEINAKNNGISFGIPVGISFYKEAFYYQLAIGDYKKSKYMQVSFRLLIGEAKESQTILALLNKLNTKLLYAKVVLESEGETPLIIIEHDFNAANIEQVNEAIYDFFNDLVDDDVTPILEEMLKVLNR